MKNKHHYKGLIKPYAKSMATMLNFADDRHTLGMTDMGAISIFLAGKLFQLSVGALSRFIPVINLFPSYILNSIPAIKM